MTHRQMAENLLSLLNTSGLTVPWGKCRQALDLTEWLQAIASGELKVESTTRATRLPERSDDGEADRQ